MSEHTERCAAPPAAIQRASSPAPRPRVRSGHRAEHRRLVGQARRQLGIRVAVGFMRPSPSSHGHACTPDAGRTSRRRGRASISSDPTVTSTSSWSTLPSRNSRARALLPRRVVGEHVVALDPECLDGRVGVLHGSRPGRQHHARNRGERRKPSSSGNFAPVRLPAHTPVISTRRRPSTLLASINPPLHRLNRKARARHRGCQFPPFHRSNLPAPALTPRPNGNHRSDTHRASRPARPDPRGPNDRDRLSRR